MEKKLTKTDVLNRIENLKETQEFIEKYPQYDLLVNILDHEEVKRIEKEHEGLFDLSENEIHNEIQIISITLIAKRIKTSGYPKLRVYIRENDNKIMRILSSG